MPIRRNASSIPATPEQRAAADEAFDKLFPRTNQAIYPWCGAVHDDGSQRWCCNREAGHEGEHREYVQRAGDSVAARWPMEGRA